METLKVGLQSVWTRDASYILKVAMFGCQVDQWWCSDEV